MFLCWKTDLFAYTAANCEVVNTVTYAHKRLQQQFYQQYIIHSCVTNERAQ